MTAQKQLLLSLDGSRTLTVCPGGSAKGRWHARVRVPLQQSQTSPWLLGKSDGPLLPLTGSVQPLSSESLRASSSTGTDPHRLLYWVVQGPRLGRLLHTQKGSPGETLGNFTQAEVRAQLSAMAQVARSATDSHVDTGTGSSTICTLPWASCCPGHACLALQKPLGPSKQGLVFYSESRFLSP